MKTLLIAAAALSLGACQSFTLEEYAAAANDLDPDCYKNVDLKLTPVIMGFWIIPVITGEYQKTCNRDQGPQGGPANVGRVVTGVQLN
jgi:hypothetical protein